MFLKAHFYIYSIIPSILLVIINTLLIRRVIKKDKTITLTRNTKKRMMNLFVIFMTIYFIVLTLPSSIAGGFFFDELLSTKLGNIILFFCDCLSFSNHAFNIFLLFFVNTRFRRALRQKLSLKKNINSIYSRETSFQ